MVSFSSADRCRKAGHPILPPAEDGHGAVSSFLRRREKVKAPNLEACHCRRFPRAPARFRTPEIELKHRLTPHFQRPSNRSNNAVDNNQSTLLDFDMRPDPDHPFWYKDAVPDA
ncbi:hypothetical protein CCUS01_10018 [Colletotrichum cuscutae]|uniref:Uncharacterized protein n=1 Tax=Colletotrichum cuscutae TaxID=1209917 RepID=A0AAI9UFY0_9PEZI|nr:hypothetical protein CCUS01_10018 [Colletotrichum cuscutae]